nr:MAG TPA_asm: hypothetical protein [Caudoviricetes sp.]
MGYILSHLFFYEICSGDFMYIVWCVVNSVYSIFYYV